MPLAEPDRCANLAGRLRAIRRFERSPRKAQRAEQQLRLERLLQHAYNTVPYYRQQFDRVGFHPSEARIDRPLPLPVLTRDHLRTRAPSLVSNAFRPEALRTAASSGSTSSPIRFQRDAECVRDKVALKLQLDRWSGLEPGDSVMMFWGASCGFSRESNWRWRLYEGVFMRRTRPPAAPSSPAFSMELMERWRWRYEKERPRTLYGRSSFLVAFATYMRGRKMRHQPKVVIATGDVLHDRDRKLLNSVFGTMPFIYYGSRDVGMIAAECTEHEGVHFHPWGSYVEFDPIGESKDGTLYRLLVTDLLNYGQPFIRYDTGDCVTLAPQSCSCGSWFPLVEKIVGRVAATALELPENSISRRRTALPADAPESERTRPAPAPREDAVGIDSRGVPA